MKQPKFKVGDTIKFHKHHWAFKKNKAIIIKIDDERYYMSWDGKETSNSFWIIDDFAELDWICNTKLYKVLN